MSERRTFLPLIPAKAGTQGNTRLRRIFWIPAYAGMSGVGPR